MFVAQAQDPALAGVGILHDDPRLGVLRDVTPALVEELERQRHVIDVHTVDVAQIRRVRYAVERAREELRREQPLKAGGQGFERDGHAMTVPAAVPGV